MNKDIAFVLVGTTHTGNIGAAARAIKNMGFSDLRLVACCPHLTKEAYARASGADAVLDNAQRFESLDDAVSDCHLVVGTSARDRHLAVPVSACRDIAVDTARAASAESSHKTAFVFGRERSGLTNDEMDRCTRLLRIPCNPDFSSLNLGQAVQIVAYECALAFDVVKVATESAEPTADGAAMQHFYEHLQRIMVATGFLDPDNPKLLMRRVRRYFERNRPSVTELNILRGILSATEKPFPPKQADD